MYISANANIFRRTYTI